MTDEQKTKIRWLNRAFHAEKAAKAWFEKAEHDQSIAERLSRGNGGGTPSGNSTENAVIRFAQTKEEAMQRVRELWDIRAEIRTAICTVDDMDAQAILVRHYLVYQSFDRIAEEMQYDKRTIQRKHKAALDKVVIECHPESVI